MLAQPLSVVTLMKYAFEWNIQYVIYTLHSSDYLKWRLSRPTKLSLICIANRLTRRTNPNWLLISLSHYFKDRIDNMRIMWALWHVEKWLNIMKHHTLVSTILFYLNICRYEWKLLDWESCVSLVCVFFSVNHWEISSNRAIDRVC